MDPIANEAQNSKRRLERFWIPIGILAFCGWAFWLSTQFERVPPILKRGIQPSDFPQLVIGLIAFLAIWILVHDLSEKPGALSKLVTATIGLLIAFALVSEIDLFLGLSLFAGSLAYLWGEKRIWAIFLVSLLVPMAVFFLFDGVFEVRFPRGIITNFWYG